MIAITSYDTVPYPFAAHFDAHPDKLASVATLFGLAPADIQACRVLELACASGGNLIPMAYALPGSRFTGVDRSPGQVKAGQAAIRELDLDNIELVESDILDWQPPAEKYDYIIAHGVFSWVPARVQERIFDLIQQRLAPQGVAFVSYNVLPGWSLRKTLRDLMAYHVRAQEDPQTRFQHALDLLALLEGQASASHPEYRAYLLHEIQEIRARANPGADFQYWYHEYLDENNEPFYFYQFVDRARQKKLEYLANAEVYMMYPFDLAPEQTAAIVMKSRDRIEREQMLDFIRCRPFRETLLVHQGSPIQLSPGASQIAGLWLRSHFQPPPGEIDQAGTAPVEFEAPSGAILTTSIPIRKAAFLHLAGESSSYTAFPTLVEAARDRLYTLDGAPKPQAFEQDAEEVAKGLLMAVFNSRSLEITTWPPTAAREASPRPEASRVASYQARRGEAATNLRHQRVSLDVLDRFLLPLLDGSRDASQLLELLYQHYRQGDFSVNRPDGRDWDSAEEIRAHLRDEIAPKLSYYAENYLLVK